MYIGTNFAIFGPNLAENRRRVRHWSALGEIRPEFDRSGQMQVKLFLDCVIVSNQIGPHRAMSDGTRPLSAKLGAESAKAGPTRNEFGVTSAKSAAIRPSLANEI